MKHRKSLLFEAKLGIGFLIARSGLKEVEKEKAVEKLARLRGSGVVAIE